MDQSINRMLGFDLGGMMNDVGQAMGKAMASGMEAAFGEMSKLMSEEQEKP